jgi:hypothetical protein
MQNPANRRIDFKMARGMMEDSIVTTVRGNIPKGKRSPG